MSTKPAVAPVASPVVAQKPATPAAPAAPPQQPVAAKPAAPAPAGDLVGIGVQMVPEANYLRVNNVVAGGGAAAVGIVVGDRVIGVDGVAIAKLGAEGAVAKILGVPGSMIAVTLYRNNAPITFNVERKKAKKKLSLDFGDMSEVLERKISP